MNTHNRGDMEGSQEMSEDQTPKSHVRTQDHADSVRQSNDFSAKSKCSRKTKKKKEKEEEVVDADTKLTAAYRD